MIDEHAATEPMWEDDNDLRCHPQEEAEEKNLDKYLYTRVCVCLSEFFFLFIETKKMENCVFGLIKRSFFISSFLDYWPTTRCTEAYTHTHTPCSILHSIDLKWHMFWTKYIANTNVNFIKLNWKFFFLVPFKLSDLFLNRSWWWWWWWWVNTHTWNRNRKISISYSRDQIIACWLFWFVGDRLTGGIPCRSHPSLDIIVLRQHYADVVVAACESVRKKRIRKWVKYVSTCREDVISLFFPFFRCYYLFAKKLTSQHSTAHWAKAGTPLCRRYSTSKYHKTLAL